MRARDIHRDRFLALFAADGRLIEGNVARLPDVEAGAASTIAPVRPTELGGKDADVARLRVCAMPDGTRLPVGDRPDSFGLLCAHMNAMLDRLETLVGDVRGVGETSHQLRTPLTRLRARIERGLRDAADAASIEATAEATLAEIDQLLGIVAALLRVREMEDHARRSRFAPVDLSRLAEDACKLHRPTAEDRGIDLVCDVRPVGTVEAMRAC